MDLHTLYVVPVPEEGLDHEVEEQRADILAEPAMDLPRAGMDHLEPTVDDDPILMAIRSGTDLVGRLEAAAEVVAVSYARLRFLELYSGSVDDLLEEGRSITRRIRAVRKYVDVELRQQKHVATEQVDLGSPAVRQILGMLVDQIAEVATEMLPPDVAAKVVETFKVRAAADVTIPWP
jgi:hypothetical protein